MMEAKRTEARYDYESGVQTQDGIELRIWLRLLTCTTLLDSAVRQKLKQTADTTLPRFDVLAQLERHDGPMSMGALSERLMVSNGNITGLVARLEKEGYVERIPSADDRRIQMVSLTPNGSKFFSKIAISHKRWVEQMMSELNVTEMSALHQLLASLKQSILAIQKERAEGGL